ncbi:hypothetical protein [Gracilibacillus salinarum]|uniref:Uncharacterized protein n=1 Tax=Gracilibacillus salinarum TaxID=2932255 RepID=A0ABY4GJX0_9BACI|nr:hypothetical protein [Gracilibacillus salinarum]UOQ84656.1 hypothetical protein MUN87_18655 [Gracilibacillus salinarum]
MKFDFKNVTQDEREQLYDEVWSQPISVVAENYCISDTTLRKHLKRLIIPIPTRGYWTKVNNGEEVSKTKLPGVTKALRKHVRNYVIKYRTDLENIGEDVVSSKEELHLLRDESKKFIKDKCSNLKVSNQLRNPHSLISDHKEEINYRKKRDRELSKSYNKVIPPKGFRDNEATLSINVSSSSINRAYRILDTIIKALDEMEGYTRAEIKEGKDTSYFAVMYTIFYFELKEKDNKLILTLVADNWLSYTNRSRQEMAFQDLKDKPLEEQIGDIIYQIFVVGNRLYAEYKLEELVQEREWEEQKRERRLEQLRKDELEEVKELTQAVSDWDKAKKIREFADDLELKIHKVKDEEQKVRLIRWLKWARDKADWIDPLVEKEDELLGKSVSLFEQILQRQS